VHRSTSRCLGAKIFPTSDRPKMEVLSCDERYIHRSPSAIPHKRLFLEFFPSVPPLGIASFGAIMTGSIALCRFALRVLFLGAKGGFWVCGTQTTQSTASLLAGEFIPKRFFENSSFRTYDEILDCLRCLVGSGCPRIFADTSVQDVRYPRALLQHIYCRICIPQQ
jgi:hypothetical protein